MRALLVFASLIVLLMPAVLNAGVDFGISGTDEGIQSFYLSISGHYKVPQQEIAAVRARQIPDDELPVVFFFAAQAQVSPSTIIDLRLSNRTWSDISIKYGFTPVAYYVPVNSKKVGPPYGKAYGHYKNKPNKKDWKNLKLSDNEVVDLVNLKFMAEYHQYPSEEIIQMRGKGKKFSAINNEIEKEKKALKDKTKGKPDKKDKVKNKSKGKGEKDID